MTLPAFTSPHADPWINELVDLESLHGGVSDAILDAIRELRAAGREGLPQPARTILVLGAAGVGKTHLFARLRRKLGPRALLVHVRPPASSELTPRLLLGEILEQLGYPSYGVRQIDALVGGTLAQSLGERPDFPRACLDHLQRRTPESREEVIETAIEQLLERHPRIDESYLRRLLSVPFVPARESRALLAWLGGRELDPVQATRIGVHDDLPNERLVPALRTLTTVAAPSAPLVLVFDQLENLTDGRGDGHLVHAYGNLVAELVDTVGYALVVQMLIDTEWSHGVAPHLSVAQRTRVEGSRLTLGLPSPSEATALLELWHDQLEQPEGPFPWPFTTDQIRTLVEHPGITPRMLVLELRRVLDGEPPILAAKATETEGSAEVTPPEDDDEALSATLAEEWEAHLVSARAHIDERAQADQSLDAPALFDGIAVLTRLGTGLDRLDVQEARRATLEAAGRHHRVGLVLEAHHTSVAAALARLTREPGVALGLRERWRDFRPTWKAVRERHEAFCRQEGTSWLWLDREDAARLVALATLACDVRAQDVSDPHGRPIAAEEVERWLREHALPSEWQITRFLRGETTVEADVEPAKTPAPATPAETAAEASAPRGRPSGAARKRPVSEATAMPESSASPPRVDGAMEALQRLRVASLERLHRELVPTTPGLTRAALLAELQRHGTTVTWLGDAIVCVTDRGTP